MVKIVGLTSQESYLTSLLQPDYVLWQCVWEAGEDAGSWAAVHTCSVYQLCHKPLALSAQLPAAGSRSLSAGR